MCREKGPEYLTIMFIEKCKDRGGCFFKVSDQDLRIVEQDLQVERWHCENVQDGHLLHNTDGHAKG